ncbi:farnesol dehydrogenase-like [Anticarsia gemmatalis]|uniref:farnesol dehydrogenase-like n=1 Tax=Anticarsia gemmatalis TaxID=129554 RepID=UPI001EAC67DE|nr:farnesol dehydrogenase [Anticarsia gemmatalis]
MERWVGKTAVVTGASAGIGAAICVSLADAGVCVVGLARRPERIEALKSQVRGKGKIVSRKCDVSDPATVAATFKWIDETFGGVHILINNAGVFYNGGFTDVGNDMISEKDMLATLDINVKGTMLCARHAVNIMKKRDIAGHVVNINSIAGHYIPSAPIFNMYPSTKYAVTGFTAGLLNELVSHKNRTKVTSLSPGLVMTELEGVSDYKDMNLPALQPQDVADAVLYVLSTPPSVNIDELTMTSVTEKRL